MSWVYVIRNTVNNKVYVGQTIALRSRWFRHLRNAERGLTHPLYDAMRKYGIASFEFIPWEEASGDAIDDVEEFWIEFFRSWNRLDGYNIERSAKRVNKEEVSARLSSSVKAGLGAEARQKISLALRGRKQSLAHAAQSRVAKAGKGKPLTDDHRRRLSEVLQGKKRSVETRERMSRAQYVLTPEQAEEIRQRYIPRKCSMEVLAREFGVSYKAVWNVLKGVTHKEELSGEEST